MSISRMVMAARILFNWKRPQITKSQADTFMMRLKKTSLYSACVHWESRRCPPLCSLLPYIQTKHQHLQATSLCSSQVHLMLFLTFSLYLTSLLMLLGPKTLGLQLLWPCLSLAMTAMVISLQLRQRPIICILGLSFRVSSSGADATERRMLKCFCYVMTISYFYSSKPCRSMGRSVHSVEQYLENEAQNALTPILCQA